MQTNPPMLLHCVKSTGNRGSDNVLFASCLSGFVVINRQSQKIFERGCNKIEIIPDNPNEMGHFEPTTSYPGRRQHPWLLTCKAAIRERSATTPSRLPPRERTGRAWSMS